MLVQHTVVDSRVGGRGDAGVEEARAGLLAPEHHHHHDQQQHSKNAAGRGNDDHQSADTGAIYHPGLKIISAAGYRRLHVFTVICNRRVIPCTRTAAGWVSFLAYHSASNKYEKRTFPSINLKFYHRRCRQLLWERETKREREVVNKQTHTILSHSYTEDTDGKYFQRIATNPITEKANILTQHASEINSMSNSPVSNWFFNAQSSWQAISGQVKLTKFNPKKVSSIILPQLGT